MFQVSLTGSSDILTGFVLGPSTKGVHKSHNSQLKLKVIILYNEQGRFLIINSYTLFHNDK